MRQTVAQLPDITRDSSVKDIVRRALAEDLKDGQDVTSQALLDDSMRVTAVVLACEDVVVSGTGVAGLVFESVDGAMQWETVVRDGCPARENESVMRIRGLARSVMAAERTALNFMQRMSGIATLTRHFVDKVAGYGVTILDTRKTTPTLRALEKYAVRCGGGQNHRMGLYDRILIKDNHRRLWRKGDLSRLELAIAAARDKSPDLEIEVEVETEQELECALRARPDWVLLDNMDPERLARCAAICNGRSNLEASGRINMENVEAVAETGVDAISLGCLTHSAPAADLSLELLTVE